MRKLTVALVLVVLLILPVVGLAGPPANSGLYKAEAQTSAAAFASPGQGWIAFWLISFGLLKGVVPPPIGEWFDELL